jgi:hypothetical protein
MGLNFGGRPTGYPKESRELSIGTGIESFGNIGHRGSRSSTKVVSKFRLSAKGSRARDLLDQEGKLARGFPGFDVFEARDLHGLRRR